MRSQFLNSGILLFSASLVVGCGISTVDHSTSGTLAIHGMVHGGQQPISGSVVQLYTVGNAGNGSASSAMLTNPVQTQADGSFDITADYTCGDTSSGALINSPSNQVYITAKGGNPGLAANTNNAAITLVTALGDCANLPHAQYVEINEVTTAAAAWALAPFATNITHIGATATNVSGIENAFLDAALLADSATGSAAVIASNLTVETDKLYALADALASCVNSDGGSACTSLFAAATPAGGTAPTGVFGAALSIVKHPGQNVSAVFRTIGNRPPFATGYTSAPNDWTMSLTVTGGALQDPTAMVVDREGNVWVANENGPLSAFSPQGTPLNSMGYGGGVVQNAYALTVDSDDNVWVAAYNATPYNIAGGVTKFTGATSAVPGTVVMNGSSPYFYDASVQFPYALGSDTRGNIFIASNASGRATIYTDAGSLLKDPKGDPSAGLGGNTGMEAFPLGIAPDTSGGFWLPDGEFHVAHYDANGTLASNADCCETGYGVATDSFGDAWIANHLGSSVSEVDSTGKLLVNQNTVGGISYPEQLSVDAAQNVWIANYGGSTITEVAGHHGSVATATAISPDLGYGNDAMLDEPVSIAPDRSGNIWVNNQQNSSLTMFFGLAAPTATPIQPSPVAP
jgi:hypothetical protein